MATQPANKSAQELELLRKKHTELDRKKAAAQANLETATTSLEQLKEQARKLYATDDIDALRAKLDEMRKSNQRKLTDYQKHLEEIDGKLAEVEKQYAGTR